MAKVLNMTRKELADKARDLGVKGWYMMSKAELERAVARSARDSGGKSGTRPKVSAKPAAKAAAKPVRKASATKRTKKTPAAVGREGGRKTASVTATPAISAITGKPKRPRPKRHAVIKPVKGGMGKRKPKSKTSTAASLRAPAARAGGAAAGAPPRRTAGAKPQYRFKPVPKVPASRRSELPSSYGRDKLVVLVRDPYWVYAYWEITPLTLNAVRRVMGDTQSARLVLRVYKVAGDRFDGFNVTRFFDLELPADADCWHVRMDEPGRSYCLEVGLLGADRRFWPLVQSNTVAMPRDTISQFVDLEWGEMPGEFEKIYEVAAAEGEERTPSLSSADAARTSPRDADSSTKK